MSHIVNHTAHVIIAGDVRIIPETPVEMDEKDLKLYPVLKKMQEDGKLEIISKEKAAEVTVELEEKTVAELKAYAASHDIKLGDATKKEDILKIIKEG